MEFAISNFRVIIRIVAFPNDRDLIAALLQVSVDTVVRNVQFAIMVPSDVHVILAKGGIFHLGIWPYTEVKDAAFGKDDVHIRWYHDGELNVSYNCIDRHLEKRGDQVAIIWEGDDPNDDAKITYRELHEHVCKFANVLKSQGVQKGDCVTIYMPMIPEAAASGIIGI